MVVAEIDQDEVQNAQQEAQRIFEKAQAAVEGT